jgi:GTP1/Obg family GTP-binding protein
MARLTLSVDEEVVTRAKRFAADHGTSVSKMVQEYLSSLEAAPELENLPPVTRSLVGILKNSDVDIEDYRRHLFEKYS